MSIIIIETHQSSGLGNLQVGNGFELRMLGSVEILFSHHHTLLNNILGCSYGAYIESILSITPAPHLPPSQKLKDLKEVLVDGHTVLLRHQHLS